MKTLFSFVMLLGFACAATAQRSPDAVPWAKEIKDPVTSVFRGEMRVYRNKLIWAAEEMPAEKYSFRPPFQKISFADLMIQIVESNYEFCAVAGGIEAPQPQKLPGADGKDKLLPAVKASFDFCQSAFSKVHDRQLAEVVYFSREMMAERVGTLFGLIGNWADHYRLATVYFRLNGLTPPLTAGEEY